MKSKREITYEYLQMIDKVETYVENPELKSIGTKLRFMATQEWSSAV